MKQKIRPPLSQPLRTAARPWRAAGAGIALGVLAGLAALPAAGAETPGFAAPAQAVQAAQAAQWARLNYVAAPGQLDRIAVLPSPGPEGWRVWARRVPEAAKGAEEHTAIAPPGPAEAAAFNSRLFPARDPLGLATARLQRLQAEADGFTLVVDYVFPDGLERFQLRFGAGRCPARAAPPQPPSPCIWPLLGDRRERIDAGGRVASGIVADYVQRSARWLEGGGMPGRAPMPAVALRADDAPDLATLGSVFDFSPALDIPARH